MDTSIDEHFVRKKLGYKPDSDSEVMRVLMDMARKLDEVCDAHAQTRELVENHMKGEEHLLNLFKTAFPGDDPSGHRRYHEALIDEAVQRKEFWRKLMFEISKFGLIGFIGWLFIQVWNGALRGPQ